MLFLLSVLLFLIGLFLMLYGADKLVDGGSSIASHFRISPFVIGLTIVSFGTSFPEFAISFVGAIHGKTDISIGNIVGSNICNIGLVLGSAAMIRPVEVHANILRKEIPFVILLSFLTWGMVWNQLISRLEGGFFVLLFVLFVWYCIYAEKNGLQEAPAEEIASNQNDSPKQGAVQIIIGLVLLFVGAELLIHSAVQIAEHFGLSQAVIGLSVIALGTSLPELVTSVVALKKGKGDIGLGNVLGSNIFNMLFVLGVTAVVRPIPSAAQFFRIDIPIMIVFTLFLIPIAKRQSRITKGEGLFFVFAYIIYIGYLALQQAVMNS